MDIIMGNRPPQRGTVDTYALAHVCGFAWALNWMEGPELAYMLGMHQVVSKMGHLDGDPVTQANTIQLPRKNLIQLPRQNPVCAQAKPTMSFQTLPLGVIKE